MVPANQEACAQVYFVLNAKLGLADLFSPMIRGHCGVFVVDNMSLFGRTSGAVFVPDINPPSPLISNNVSVVVFLFSHGFSPLDFDITRLPSWVKD